MIRGGEAEEKREVQTEVNTNEREARSGGRETGSGTGTKDNALFCFIGEKNGLQHKKPRFLVGALSLGS